MNGLTLAYIGDGYYELKIRKHLIDLKLTDVNDLHKQAIKYTSGQSQAQIMDYLMTLDTLSTEDIDFYKRGRNASSRGRGSMDAKTYGHATGFEAMIGGLYLHNIQRADDIIALAIAWIEKGSTHGKNSGQKT